MAMKLLILIVALFTADALRIQAKKKEAKKVAFDVDTPSTGNSGTIAFGKISAPIYDISDEPFQNIDFAGRMHGGDKKSDHDLDFDSDQDQDIDGPAQIEGTMHVAAKKAAIAAAMKECTPENSQLRALENPVGKIPSGFPEMSALPKGTFYAKQMAQHSQATMGCSGDSCQLPTYLAPREEAKEPQAIPRIIWMTVSDTLLNGKAGPYQYGLMAEHFKMNPEYEWILSGDEMSAAFMKNDEVKKTWQVAYAKARNGAERADIWRYTVLHKYGGVYMDSDMTCIVPYRTFVDSKANVVQQCTLKGGDHRKSETSQYALFFSPGSKLLETLLDDISARFESPERLPLTIVLTGPGALARVYQKFAVCGMAACGGHSPNKVCGIQSDSCEHSDLGKVVLLNKVRDFNTGHVWHKRDVCALAETRSKVSHWAQQKGDAGGRGKKFDTQEITG